MTPAEYFEMRFRRQHGGLLDLDGTGIVGESGDRGLVLWKSTSARANVRSVVRIATSELPLRVDTVEKPLKRIAAKIRRSELVSENRCAMPPQSSYGGRLLIQLQFLYPPASFFERRAHGPANFASFPKTEFFNSIGMTRNTQVEQIASAVHSEAGHSILAYFPESAFAAPALRRIAFSL